MSHWKTEERRERADASWRTPTRKEPALRRKTEDRSGRKWGKPGQVVPGNQGNKTWGGRGGESKAANAPKRGQWRCWLKTSTEFCTSHLFWRPPIMGHGAVGVGARLPQAELLTRGEKKRANSCTPLAPTDYVVIKDSVPSGKFYSALWRCKVWETGTRICWWWSSGGRKEIS